MKAVSKAGRLANGYEADQGRVVHLVEDENSYAGKSLCGTSPANADEFRQVVLTDETGKLLTIEFYEKHTGGCMELTVKNVHNKDIIDILVSAFEGGSNYWYDDLEPLKRTSSLKNTSDRFYDDLVKNGFSLVDKETGKSHKVSSKDLQHGFQTMAEKYPTHFGDFKEGNFDAETADVYLQCVVFGEAIYG